MGCQSYTTMTHEVTIIDKSLLPQSRAGEKQRKYSNSSIVKWNFAWVMILSILCVITRRKRRLVNIATMSIRERTSANLSFARLRIPGKLSIWKTSRRPKFIPADKIVTKLGSGRSVQWLPSVSHVTFSTFREDSLRPLSLMTPVAYYVKTRLEWQINSGPHVSPVTLIPVWAA